MIKIRTPAFKYEELIPREYTCDGENISPPLEWQKIPEGTESFALIMEDPDSSGPTFTHWVIYNIPGNVMKLPEAIEKAETIRDGIKQGMNDFAGYGYGGPCPKEGIHRYFFRLYACDTKFDIDGEVTKDKLVREMQDHIIDEGELMGRYRLAHEREEAK